jgi:hypothetical protein
MTSQDIPPGRARKNSRFPSETLILAHLCAGDDATKSGVL